MYNRVLYPIGISIFEVYMRNDIERFLTLMGSILSDDMIKYIVQLVSSDKNMQIIKTQKQFRVQLNKDIIKLFNTYYYDSNFILYKNEKNQFVLENMGLINKQIYIFSNRHALPAASGPSESIAASAASTASTASTTEESQMVLQNQSSADTTNEIVLFDHSSNEVMYDENGFPIERRIKLDIVYIL